LKLALTFGLFLLAAFGQPARAANPSDIDFTLRLTSNISSFHLGEPFEFEISYASGAEQKYLTSRSNPIPELGSVTVRVAPLDGALDRRVLRPCWGGIGVSHLSSGPVYLTSRPITESADLTNWYRFQKPGHYSLTVTSHMVLRPKGVDEGGGQEILNLESNTVDFDILPPDPGWETQELQTILHDLDDAKYPGDRARAQYRLALLGTPEAASKLVELYLSSSDSEKYSYVSGLTESSQVDVMIPLLETALSNSEVSPSGLPDLLAQLQVRKQLGISATISDDPASQQKSQAECKDRRELYDAYLRRENELVLSRIERQPGPQQPAAIYEAWHNLENQYAHDGQGVSTAQASEGLTQLRVAVLNIAEKLEPDQQTQFMISEWKILPHEQLLPMIRNLALTHRLDADKLWCEGWPRECSAAILSDAVKPDSRITAIHVLLVSEAEYPEMDSELRKQLGDPGFLQGSVQSQRTAALILRAGSRALLPAVNDALSRLAADHQYICEVEGYLLGYIVKVAPEDGQRQLNEMLQDGKCGDELFRILNSARYSDELVPVAVKALDSPNLGAAAMAALFLGNRGSAEVEDALWQRLNALWLLWHDRAGELRNTVTPRDQGIQSRSSRLEQSLASALSHASNWKLTPSEHDRLRDGCLTEQCQAIADDKMWLGL
jgi:hypothetical protein